MGYYDAYNAILSIAKSTPRDSVIDITKREIKSTFFNSPSYYQVQVNTPSSPYTTSNLDSWIVDDSKTKEAKQIQLIPDQTLNFGDIIIWNNEHWITTQVDNMGGIYDRGSIQKCYSSLKWLDNNGDVKEAWFTIVSDSRGLGLNDGQVMILPDERRYIAIQNNADTMKIGKGNRFIFDSGRCWRVTNLNTLYSGLVHLELEENDIDTSIDNVSLRVADYYGNVPSYSLTVLNGHTFSINAGSTLNLITEVRDRGNVITNKPLTFTSSNPSIATVDGTGKVTTIANGSVSISVSLTDVPTITDTVNITVQFSTTANKIVSILGKDAVLLGSTETYTREIKNNGVVDNASFVQWYLYADDGISSTNLATLSFTSTTQCTIKPNTKAQVGNVKLKAVVIGSPSVVCVKTINIKGII